jgi:hypothetical protein
MRDLDRTVDITLMVPIIARRAALLVEATDRVRLAICEDERNALLRDVFVCLVRLAESAPQDIRGALNAEFQEGFDQIYLEAEQANGERRS